MQNRSDYREPRIIQEHQADYPQLREYKAVSEATGSYSFIAHSVRNDREVEMSKITRKEILDIHSCLFRHLGEEAKDAVVIMEDEDFREVEKKASASRLFFVDSLTGKYRNPFSTMPQVGTTVPWARKFRLRSSSTF